MLAQDAPPADAKPKADIIFMHANVYTGVPANTPFSSILREEAIAVRGDRILAVGKNIDIEKLKGPQTQVVDLGGHFVMPGFNDAHLHLDDAGSHQAQRRSDGREVARRSPLPSGEESGTGAGRANGFSARAGMKLCGR